MKRTLLAVSVVALLQWSICSESGDNPPQEPSPRVRYELVQSRLDGMQLKLTEMLEKLDDLLKHQSSTNERLKELAAIPRPKQSSFTVPTGCVRIRSVRANKYLSVASIYDNRRRELSLQVDYERWILFREADYYRISRRHNQEDLFAAGDQTYDAQRRRIFTWIPGFRADEGKWEIEEAHGFPGMVHIRSGHYGEYLFAADFDDQVFTWIPKWSPAKDAQYLWQIEQCV